MGLFKSVKAAGKGFAKGYAEAGRPLCFRAGGKQVVCPHCENSLFHERALKVTQINFIFQQPPSAVTALLCAHCSHIQWFGDTLESSEPQR